ncbi:MAG TPA: hypothetical protein VJ624_00845 [Thermodesulfobacteriota bacterium]|nr:hypothetical protein [Thermodesulfobacteriota bacterium]
MPEEKETNVRAFLKEFKKIMVKGRGLDIIPRRETMGALADLGLTKNNLKEEIMALYRLRIIVKVLNQIGIEQVTYGYSENRYSEKKFI